MLINFILFEVHHSAVHNPVPVVSDWAHQVATLVLFLRCSMQGPSTLPKPICKQDQGFRHPFNVCIEMERTHFLKGRKDALTDKSRLANRVADRLGKGSIPVYANSATHLLPSLMQSLFSDGSRGKTSPKAEISLAA